MRKFNSSKWVSPEGFSFIKSSESNLNGLSPMTITGFPKREASSAILELMVISFSILLKNSMGELERSIFDEKQV